MELDVKKAVWDLSPLEKDKSFEEKRKDWRASADRFILKWKGRKDYLEKPKILKEALDDYEKFNSEHGSTSDEYCYFWLKTHQDENDSELKAKFLKVEEFAKKIENDTSFFTINISKIEKDKQKNFVNSVELSNYRHFLEELFARAKHILSEKEEKIMNLKETGSYSMWTKMLSGFLSKEEVEVLDEDGKIAKKSFSDLFGLINNKNKKIRDCAANAINDILSKHAETAESEINAVLMNKKINDELRNFKRPDESRHLGDDIDSKIVDSLVEAVSENLEISRRFYELKAKILGLKKLQYWERNLRYGSLDKKYEYKNSMNLIQKVFKNLDPKFEEILKKFLDNGQIDAFPRKNKSQGAFCVYFLKKHPVYVLLNYNNEIRDVTTIAHEFGHAINNELMREKQNSLNFSTPTSTAEIASTFMEDFVFEELMKGADDELKLALMMEKINDDIGSIMRQVSCYMFEQELHKEFRKKGYLSKEEIGEIFKKHMKNYMGDFVEQSDGSENWWVYWSHIRNYFYNYSYASGLIISKALQKKVKGNPRYIEKVKQFLSSGVSKSPKNIFAEIGIDITKKEFWNGGIGEVRDLLNEMERLARKRGKI